MIGRVAAVGLAAAAAGATARTFLRMRVDQQRFGLIRGAALIADSGGTIGIMLESGFLAPSRGEANVKTFVDHVEHVVRVVGDDHVSLGSDFDGMISPPKDLTTPLAYPRVVAELMRRGYGETTVRKFLATNALRTIEAMRG